MRYLLGKLGLAALVVLTAFISTAVGQTAPKPQEVGDDGVPVLLKHLPRYEEVRNFAVFARSRQDLEKIAGRQPVLELIELSAGTEAVAAAYPQGNLVVVEYITPQASVDADAKFRQRLEASQNPPVYYRRIGNYSAFVFDAPDEQAAAALLDQVRYEKKVQWLGSDPFDFKKIERAFVFTTRDIFLSTVIFISAWIVAAVLGGALIGYFYFRFREGKRAEYQRFTDAGGMTRLNLDDLSEPVAGE
jgi:hypothetical protein